MTHKQYHELCNTFQKGDRVRILHLSYGNHNRPHYIGQIATVNANDIYDARHDGQRKIHVIFDNGQKGIFYPYDIEKHK